MKRKRACKKIAACLVIVLVFSVLVIPKAKAANAIKTDRECSVEFEVSATEFKELNSIAIPVHLYKVASVDESGEFTAETVFKAVDVSSVDHESDAPAAVWEKRASEAAAIVEKEKTEATASAEIVDGKTMIQNLQTGLYLVMAEDVTSVSYKYSFQPYLISLPNNYYYSTSDDEWIYDLTGSNAIGLKPQEEQRFGNLKITKNLVNQNVTWGGKATFVFQVDIESLDEKKESKLVTISFDSTGSQSAELEKIPAGSKVTVTEVYSGASYTADQAEAEITILADQDNEVGFSNRHNNVPNGGYGINNHFEKNDSGQYQWMNQRQEDEQQ